MLVKPTTDTLARVHDQPCRQAPPPSRIQDRPTWLISRTYARSHKALTDGFEASGTGLRSYHYRLLAALEEAGPASQPNLGRYTSVDRSDIVTVLSELERLALAQRTVDPDNRRRNIVSITRARTTPLPPLPTFTDEFQHHLLP